MSERASGRVSPAARRLMREAAELAVPQRELRAQPLDDNLFEWHFTVRGPPNTDFADGIYHGRVLLPEEYPMRPPHIVVSTPNGRFEVDKKICLSISGHHPETWQPSWSIRTALVALVAFMPSPAEGTIGALDYSPQERRALARRSRDWRCDSCGPTASLLDEAPPRRVEPPPPAPPPTRERPADSLDQIKDCVIACLLLSIAIFAYRRLGIVSYLTDLVYDS